VRVTRFGPGGQVELLSFTRLPSGSRLEVAVFGDRLELETSLTARYNGINVLAALAAYHALGLPLEKAHVGAAQIKLSRPGRGEEILLPGDGLLINDAYNGNPLSMTAALDHLAERAASRRRVAVLGDMIELGPGASIYHRRVGAYAARREVAALLAVGPLARGYVEGARGVPLTRWIPTVDACLVAVRSVLMPGDCILVKGSRAMGLGAIVDALRSPPA
jgi:UDP-N-acetylmuramoyl-tripeptide--D-alanyl-D-alanine ligase